MEQLRAWVLSLCFACLACGILQHLSASRARFSVIKLVLTLYILLTALTPLQSAAGLYRMPEIPDIAQPAQTIDSQDMLLDATRKNLEQAVVQSLAEQGITDVAVQLTLAHDDTSITVTDVILTPARTADAEPAATVVTQMFGTDTTVTVREEG